MDTETAIATLTIKNAADFTPRLREATAQWLEAQAAHMRDPSPETGPANFAARYRARLFP
jgi:hypothetical protein